MSRELGEIRKEEIFMRREKVEMILEKDITLEGIIGALHDNPVAWFRCRCK